MSEVKLILIFLCVAFSTGGAALGLVGYFQPSIRWLDSQLLVTLGFILVFLGVGTAFFIPLPQRWWGVAYSVSVLAIMSTCLVYLYWRDHRSWSFLLYSRDVEVLRVTSIQGLPQGWPEGPVQISKTLRTLSLDQADSAIPTSLTVQWQSTSTSKAETQTLAIKPPPSGGFWILNLRRNQGTWEAGWSNLRGESF